MTTTVVAPVDVQEEDEEHEDQYEEQEQEQQQQNEVAAPGTVQVGEKMRFEKWYADNLYVGELKDTKRHGCGFIRYGGGRTDRENAYYFGDWKEDLICGKGIRHLGQSTYEGDWLDGRKHGRGTLVFNDEDGEQYEGGWNNDLREGYGRVTWKNGTGYEGEWKNSRMNGKGTYWWPNGDRYEGDWLNDNHHGYGVQYWGDGSTYSGDWVNDDRCGRGVYRMADGRYLIGKYDNDERCGEAEFYWPNGDTWIGTFSSMKQSSGCKTIALTNDKITGKWIGLGLENGDGEMLLHRHSDGVIVKGVVVNDVFIPNTEASTLATSTITSNINDCTTSNSETIQ